MKVSVIGSGFSGLSASAVLAKAGYEVEVFEKNSQPGGRARKFTEKGFTYDMGPTWYWLPDVFENFFAQFGKTPSNYYKLHRLDPSYRMFFGKDDFIDIPATHEKLYQLFETLEPGAAKNLKKFLQEAAFKYNLAMKEIIFKPSLSFMEYINWSIITGVSNVNFFKSISKYIRSLFKNEKIIRILEFPVIFLGAAPSDTPSLYSMMNHADLTLGTWYPQGGMYEVINALVKLNRELGVKINLDEPVKRFNYKNTKITEVLTSKSIHSTDAVVAGADYQFIDQQVLDNEYREYSPKYWETRKMAPSAMLFYIGLNKEIKGLEHHNLFFDTDFEKHADEIYKTPRWPTNPAFYVSVSSKTDKTSAPAGGENLIILIPVSSGLTDTEDIKEQYYQMVISRLENLINDKISENIIYKRLYAASDFINDYNSFKGNAYGLSNTLLQTAFLKPKMRSSKISNLFYCGQLTVPGPGVPPSIISGEIAAQLVIKNLKL
jgi:phytoene desaturase